MPLVINTEAYEAFLYLLDILHKQTYDKLFIGLPNESIGALGLIDELKELKLRLKDALANG